MGAIKYDCGRYITGALGYKTGTFAYSVSFVTFLGLVVPSPMVGMSVYLQAVCLMPMGGGLARRLFPW